MKKITYETGRTYDAAQVLEIVIEQDVEDEFGARDIVATFVDSSRRISGRVKTVVFDPADIGRAVFSAYDKGCYAAV